MTRVALELTLYSCEINQTKKLVFLNPKLQNCGGNLSLFRRCLELNYVLGILKLQQ